MSNSSIGMEKKEFRIQKALGTLSIKEWMVDFGCTFKDGICIEPGEQYALTQIFIKRVLEESDAVMIKGDTRNKAMAIIAQIQTRRIPKERYDCRSTAKTTSALRAKKTI